MRQSDSWVIKKIRCIILRFVGLILCDYCTKGYDISKNSGGMSGSPQTPEHLQYQTDILAVYQQYAELWRMLYERNEVIANLAQQLAQERELKYLNAQNAISNTYPYSN